MEQPNLKAEKKAETRTIFKAGKSGSRGFMQENPVRCGRHENKSSQLRRCSFVQSRLRNLL